MEFVRNTRSQKGILLSDSVGKENALNNERQRVDQREGILPSDSIGEKLLLIGKDSAAK